MNKSDILRKLIREEIKKVISEDNLTDRKRRRGYKTYDTFEVTQDFGITAYSGKEYTEKLKSGNAYRIEDIMTSHGSNFGTPAICLDPLDTFDDFIVVNQQEFEKALYLNKIKKL